MAPSSDLVEFHSCSHGLGQVTGPEIPAVLPRLVSEPPVCPLHPETPFLCLHAFSHRPLTTSQGGSLIPFLGSSVC